MLKILIADHHGARFLVEMLERWREAFLWLVVLELHKKGPQRFDFPQL
jgi:hypothetical protein